MPFVMKNSFQNDRSWLENHVEEGMIVWLGTTNRRKKKFHCLQAALLWTLLIIAMVGLSVYAVMIGNQPPKYR